ncbi:MAG: helix-turn-helix domain-containing protein, partial [Verrucomicrobiaceae bacterium]
MVETIGKKLCQARLAKGLSLDEAAHATRMRPDKLIALENDDHSRFGSTAYAKGFLQIYGRFLGVDVSEQVARMETPRHVSISDYQYLNNAPQPEPNRVQFQRYGQRPSVLPLVVALGLVVVGAVAMIGYWVNVNMQRLELKDPAQPVATRTLAPAAVESTPATPSPRLTDPG